MVDDSIVRGNTQRALVRMLREAGAAEVHVRISSPPVRWPCFYGIDFASRAELIANGISVDEIPIDDLVVPLAIVDISARAQDNPDTSLTPDDIKAWEAKNGPLPEGCCVAMSSGWDKLLMTPRFAGRDDAGKNHTPGFHAETAQLLMSERSVKGIGVDTLSLDTGLNTGPFPVHYPWLGSGRWGVECLANLDTLPAKGATLILAGPKVKGGTGGPSRVIALV